MNLFTTFAKSPKQLRFETQEKQETIILFLRQHIIILLPWLLIGIILFFAPTVLFPVVYRFVSKSWPIPIGYTIVGTVFWYVLTFGFILSKFLSWFFNIFIVTNERIVDINFVNLLHKDIAETRLERVQDISYETSGIFPAMFNFGDVTIQTAGEMPNFIFERVPQPSEVVDIISDAAKLRVKKQL